MPTLTPDEVVAFLTEPGHLLRLATVDSSGAPRVVPIWFLYSEGRVLFTPRERSAWWADLQRDPRCALTIDEEPPPYRKVVVRSTVTVDFAPGADDEWRDTYRSIARRYVPPDAAEAYIQTTIDEPRALLSVPCDPSTVTTWRMPVAGEDPKGIWAPRYYHS